jgi:PPP family 3-phenylpropionic acid transporter
VTLVVIRVFSLIDEASSTSIMTAMLVTAGLCLLSSSALPDHHRVRRQAAARADTGGGFDGVFWLFVLVALTHRLGMSAYYFFFTNYLRDVLKMEQAAWVWCIGAAAEVPLLFAGGWVIRRFGIPAMLMASLAAVSIRLCVYAWVPVLAVILPVQVLHALTFGAFHAASIEFLRRKVPAARRGVAMALYMSLALGVSNWIGSSVGGVIVEHWGYASLYLIYAAPPLVGLVCVALAWKKLRLAQTA